MFGIIRDDFTKMSMYNLQNLMIAYAVSTMEKELLAFTFPHLRMFTLYIQIPSSIYSCENMSIPYVTVGVKDPVDTGWFLKSCSIKVKKKCTEKWRWPSRKLKTWYMWNNITIIIFPKKDFSYFDLYRVYTGSFLWTVQNYLALAPKIFAFTPSLKAQIIDNLLTFTLLQRNAFKNVISVLLYPLDWEAHFG